MVGKKVVWMVFLMVALKVDAMVACWVDLKDN
jgi:hypothetical protein